MRGSSLGALLLLVLAEAATGAELRVQVSDQRGKPVADAVVTALPAPGAPAAAAPASKTSFINQVDLAFVPYLEVFRPGDKVVFHNGDRTRHHVYSFSAAKSFEFMLSPGGNSTSLVLDRPGVVAVGCNIHDSMIAFLYVTEAPWVARTGADGVARLVVPDGAYTVKTWQPRLRPGRAETVLENVQVAGAAAKPLSFRLALLPDTRRPADRERARY
jgi:plastocyanin